MNIKIFHACFRNSESLCNTFSSVIFNPLLAFLFIHLPMLVKVSFFIFTIFKFFSSRLIFLFSFKNCFYIFVLPPGSTCNLVLFSFSYWVCLPISVVNKCFHARAYLANALLQCWVYSPGKTVQSPAYLSVNYFTRASCLHSNFMLFCSSAFLLS